MSEELVGTITHYFKGPGVAVVAVTEGELHLGDQIHIVGHTSDFTEEVTSMEVDHAKVESVKAGEEVALRVIERARQHDKVFRVVP